MSDATHPKWPDDTWDVGRPQEKVVFTKSDVQVARAAALEQAVTSARGSGIDERYVSHYSQGRIDAASDVRDLISEPASQALAAALNAAKQERDREWVSAFCQLDVAIGITDTDIVSGLTKALAAHVQAKVDEATAPLNIEIERLRVIATALGNEVDRYKNETR